MANEHAPFARPQRTEEARLHPTIWRVADVTELIDAARAGGHDERNQLFVACVERFQYIVRQIVREDRFERVAPSVTEIVHEVFAGDLQAVLDSPTIGGLNRRDFERLFVHKVRQHLKRLVERLRSRKQGPLDEVSIDQSARGQPGSTRAPLPQDWVERIEKELLLQDALDSSLDDDTRDLVVQRYYFGRTLADLSAQTGLAVSTLHSRIRAAEDKLGRMLVVGVQDDLRPDEWEVLGE